MTAFQLHSATITHFIPLRLSPGPEAHPYLYPALVVLFFVAGGLMLFLGRR